MTQTAKEFQALLKAVAKGKHGSRNMTSDEAQKALDFIFSDEAHSAQVGAFLTAMRFKGTTVEEFTGFARSVKNHSEQIELNHLPGLLNPNGPYDGRKVSLNLNVGSALVAAAGGVPVLLHSSTGLTPKRGVTSAEVLEHLGIVAFLDLEGVKAMVERSGFAFIHSSRFSHGIEKLRQIRETLLYRSFLHGLEVLNNPGGAKLRIIGAAHDHFLERFARAAEATGEVRHLLAVGGLDGGDEAPLQKTGAYEIQNGEGRAFELDPAAYGIACREKFAPLKPAQTAEVIFEALSNAPSREAEREAIIYNGGLRLYVGQKAADIASAIKLAREIVNSGEARKKLDELAAPPFSGK